MTALVALGAAWPLLAFGGLYLQDLANDAVRAPMWHQFVAMELVHGRLPGTLTNWGWPAPFPSSTLFPPAFDPLLTLPFWLLGWPGAWRAAQASWVVMNGVGGVWLARSLGASRAGACLAGVMMVFNPAIWVEILLGHPNSAVLGLPLAALAAWLDTARPGPGGRRRVIVAALLGALSAGVYPLYLVMLTPLALGGMLAALRPAGRDVWARVGGSVAGAVLLVLPVLIGMAGAREGKGLGSWDGSCPALSAEVVGENLARLAPPAWTGQIGPWLAIGFVAALAAVPLAGRLRLRAAALSAFAILLCFVSLGPCARWDLTMPAVVVPALTSLGFLSWTVNAMGRFLAVAGSVFALVAGIGVGGLAEGGPLRKGLATALGLGLVLACALPMRPDLLDRRHYKKVRQTAQATFLLNAELAPGVHPPIADLPFDQGGQFLVALQAPLFPRVNPPTPFTPRYRADVFVGWLLDLGDGHLTGQTPTLALAISSGVRWVFHDRSRCSPPHLPPAPCAQNIREALTRVLGAPQRLDDAVVVWTIPPG